MSSLTDRCGVLICVGSVPREVTAKQNLHCMHAPSLLTACLPPINMHIIMHINMRAYSQ